MLLEVLTPRIANREWDVMAQLAFQLQNKKNVGAGDELLVALVERSHENTSNEGWNLLSFATRCLQFIVPKPKVRRYLVTECVEHCIAWGCERLEKAKPKVDSADLKPTSPQGLLADLVGKTITPPVLTHNFATPLSLNG